MGDFEELKVDFENLIESESRLGRLYDDFDTMIDRNNNTSDIWGHRTMRNAVDEATTNMGKNRDDILARLEAVQGMVTNTIDNFEEADQELARELRRAMEEDG